MSVDTIEETTRLWQEQPEKARSAPAVTARTEGSQATLTTGPFSWQVDLPQPLGGTNQAPSPTALLLGALAGCAAVFIRDTLAPQLGVHVETVEATARCEADARGLLGLDGASPDLENLQLEIRVESPSGDEALQRLYQAWQARCPVYLALTKPTPVALSLQSGASPH